MRIIIIGAGDIGFQLSRRLSQDGHDTVIMLPSPATWKH